MRVFGGVAPSRRKSEDSTRCHKINMATTTGMMGDSAGLKTHKMAITRNYLSQPRLSKYRGLFWKISAPMRHVCRWKASSSV